MKSHYSGMGFDCHPGSEVDRPEAEALRLIAKGYAEPVMGQQIERAVQPPPPQTSVSVAPAASKKGKKK